MKHSTVILKLWQKLFNANDINIVKTYSNDAVFLGTFAKNIKQGRALISTYFVGLFKKENLNVQFTKEIYVNDIEDGYIVSGIYIFSYTENGATQTVKARYSFTIQYLNGKPFIINQHSSIVPE
jgi:hypothetical protein